MYFWCSGERQHKRFSHRKRRTAHPMEWHALYSSDSQRAASSEQRAIIAIIAIIAIAITAPIPIPIPIPIRIAIASHHIALRRYRIRTEPLDRMYQLITFHFVRSIATTFAVRSVRSVRSALTHSLIHHSLYALCLYVWLPLALSASTIYCHRVMFFCTSQHTSHMHNSLRPSSIECLFPPHHTTSRHSLQSFYSPHSVADHLSFGSVAFSLSPSLPLFFSVVCFRPARMQAVRYLRCTLFPVLLFLSLCLFFQSPSVYVYAMNYCLFSLSQSQLVCSLIGGWFFYSYLLFSALYLLFSLLLLFRV